VIALHFAGEEAAIRAQMEVDAKNNPAIRSYSTTSAQSCGVVCIRPVAAQTPSTNGEDLLFEWDNGIIRAREWASEAVA
jgi:hypothetical protein